VLLENSDYSLCPPGNDAITTTLPSQAEPPAATPARGDATWPRCSAGAFLWLNL
jgi:hypothetical protein